MGTSTPVGGNSDPGNGVSRGKAQAENPPGAAN